MCLHFPGLPRPLLTEVPAALVTKNQGLSSSNYNTRSGDPKRLCCNLRDGSLSKFAAERIIRSRLVGSEPLPLHCTVLHCTACRSLRAPPTALHADRSEPLPLALHCTYCNIIGKPTSLPKGFLFTTAQYPLHYNHVHLLFVTNCTRVPTSQW